MVAEIADIECLIVGSEAEALLAEQAFIKQYRPRFNIRLRDDKSYPFIASRWTRTSPACTSRASAIARIASTSVRIRTRNASATRWSASPASS